MSPRGVVAAGHPATAEAGAEVLRAGGNAVDAAVGAVLMSFAAESPLTGLGAGGYMLVHDHERTEVLDFFVGAPGLGGTERRAELLPVPVRFTAENAQIFNVGAASCGVPGMPAGIEMALREFGSRPLAELAEPAIAAAREGVEISSMQAYVIQILEPILTADPEIRALYAPSGERLKEGEHFHWPELADALETFASNGSAPFVSGAIAEAVCAMVAERGGNLAMEDMTAYRPALRAPVKARFRGRDVYTNPPPSSGGILIAYALELLERAGASSDTRLIEVMAAAQGVRDESFLAGLADERFGDAFLAAAKLDAAASRLGSTTHITAADSKGRCATVTCSNGTGSGIVVPGTGIHVNNMLGEEDLNPLGYHRSAPGSRLPSMMSPTVILHDGELEAGVGSAGSNRIRSAILKTIVHLIDEGGDVQDAVDAPRSHYAPEAVHAEPGIDPEALAALEAAGHEVVRWPERNLYFGGVQAVSRDPATGELAGAGDPRRGGAVAYA